MKALRIAATPADGIVKERKWWLAVPITGWVIAGFVIAYFATRLIVVGLSSAGIGASSLGSDVFATLISAVLYLILLAIILGASRLIRLWPREFDYRRLLGLARLLKWSDIGLAALGIIVTFAIAFLLTLIATAIPGFNAGQAQDTGFSPTLTPATSVPVFLLLVVIAPVMEEIIFRGYLFGALRRAVPVGVAALITSVLFGIVHLQWNVGIQVFAMSLVSCYLRFKTGSLWASILLHMLKNGIAFYFLYIAAGSL